MADKKPTTIPLPSLETIALEYYRWEARRKIRNQQIELMSAATKTTILKPEELLLQTLIRQQYEAEEQMSYWHNLYVEAVGSKNTPLGTGKE